MSYSRGSNTSSMVSTPTATVKTYSVRVPKNVKKTFNVMKFSGYSSVDFSEWRKVEMKRENNSKEFQEEREELPEFGVGSAFGHKQREEARRKRFATNRKNYEANEQPWILKSHGNSKKKYKGSREGSVGENSAYYVFTEGDNGVLEAYPLKEWYNFQPIQRFKTLTSEEAEEEYSKRTKCMNLFSIMLNKRLKNDSDDVEDEEEEGNNKGKINKKSEKFKVSEKDDWIISANESSDNEGSRNSNSSDEDSKRRKNKTKNANNKKKAKRNTKEEAVEDSDDGDDEGRECDYISSDGNESELDYSLRGVSEEKGLKIILDSDEDDSEDEEREKEAQQNVENSTESSDFSADTDTDENTDTQKSNGKKRKKSGKKLVAKICKTIKNPNSSLKRKRDLTVDDEPNKKARMGTPVNNLSLNEIGITEQIIRKYLMRKPTTTMDLISKFKLKKLKADERKQAESAIALIIKRINPKHEIINGKMYFSL